VLRRLLIQQREALGSLLSYQINANQGIYLISRMKGHEDGG
jgi:hypothetical protein